jgi:tRNA(fMet)-specific endonuclease VapC
LRKEGLAISVISLAELYEGVYYSTHPAKNERALKDFLTGVSILGIDEEVCKVFGRGRGRLRQEKKTVSDFDLLIASTCLRWNLSLLTNNRKHFEGVEGLNIVSTS